GCLASRILLRVTLAQAEAYATYWNLRDELGDFAVLLGAGFFVGDYQFLEADQAFHQCEIFWVREDSLHCGIWAAQELQQDAALLRPERWVLLVSLRVAE